MKAAALSSLALAPALAAAQNLTFFAGLNSALQSADLTQLATVAAAINGTSVGQSLLANISDGNAFTIFAPNNNAWSYVPSNISSNATILADILSYHVLPGNLSSYTSCYPNVTLARTFYDDPLTVHLEGGKSQVVAWATRDDGKVHVLNQRNDTTILSTTSYGNLTIFVIDYVLQVPENLEDTIPTNPWLNATEAVLKSATLSFYNDTTMSTGDVTFFDALNEGYHGFTMFWPDNAAIEEADAILASIASNRTALNDVLFNHIINATTVYSPYLTGSQDYITTAGQTLTFSINSTGQYVTRGTTTARIVQPDVLLPNGVVHIIDGVLRDAENNPEAGSSALSSALAAATSSEPAQTAPIGFTITSSLSFAAASSTAGGSSGSGNSSTSSDTASATGSASTGAPTVIVGGGGSGSGNTTIATAPGIVSTSASTNSSTASASSATSNSTASTATIIAGGAFTTTVTNSDGSVSTSTGVYVSSTVSGSSSATGVVGGGLFTTTITNSDGSVSTSTGTSSGSASASGSASGVVGGGVFTTTITNSDGSVSTSVGTSSSPASSGSASSFIAPAASTTTSTNASGSASTSVVSSSSDSASASASSSSVSVSTTTVSSTDGSATTDNAAPSATTSATVQGGLSSSAETLARRDAMGIVAALVGGVAMA